MKICLTCSHGGHLTEIMQLMGAFEGHEVYFITYDSPRSKDLDKKYVLRNPVSDPVNFFMSLPKVFFVLLLNRPDVIVSTGSEIAIPVFYVARMLGIRTIFIESLCRVKEPSGTGRIVYPVSSVFLVQWRQLLEKYGKKAQYWGSVF